MSTRPALIGFETRLLAELRQVVAERAASGALPAAAPHPAAPNPAAPSPSAPSPSAPSPAARRQAGRGWPHRRLAMTGALSAAVAAGVAVALTVTLPGNGGHPAGPAGYAAATTAAAVLNNAALAAQSEPAVNPRPDQFVYLKLLEVDGKPHVTLTESWTSVSGTRKGLRVDVLRNGHQPAKTYRGSESWCEHGFVDGLAQVDGKPGRRCTPREFAAYKPWVPSTTAGMLTFLAHSDPRHPDPARPSWDLDTLAFWLLTSADLTPAQQAAMFHALAGIPGLRVVPMVTDVLGRTGIGVRNDDHGDIWTTIFDPRSFRLLGATFSNRSGQRGWAVTVPATVVDQAGQRP